MQSTITNEGPLQLSIEIVIPADVIETSIRSELTNITKKVVIKGYRKGKAPLSLVTKQYGAEARIMATEKQMQVYFAKTVQKEELRVVGTPNYTPGVYTFNGDLTFTVKAEVLPDIILKGLEDSKAERPVVEITESDIDKAVYDILAEHKTWVDTQDPIKSGDRITIDFAGTIDGEAFEGGTATDFVLVTGDNRMIPGFEENIYGHVIGDEFDLPITFPENYGGNLAGKNAVFAIKVKSIQVSKDAEVTPELLKLVGVEDGTIETLRDLLRKGMEGELKQLVENLVRETVINNLYTANPVEVPGALINSEIENIAARMQQRYGYHQSAGDLREMYYEQAKRTAAIGMLLEEVVKANQIDVAEGEVIGFLQQQVAGQPDPEEAIKKWFQADPTIGQKIQGMLFEKKAVELLIDKSSITEKAMSFEEVKSLAQLANRS